MADANVVLDTIAKDGKISNMADKGFIEAAIINVGRVTKDVDLSKKDLNGLKELAHQSVDTAYFAENSALSGKDGILNAYVDDLINRSLERDKEARAKGETSPDGTHLRQFMEGTREATKNIDFKEVDKAPTAYVMSHQKDLDAIQKGIRQAAHDNIDPTLIDANGKGRTIEQDLVKTIQASRKGSDEDKDKDVFKGTKAAEPKAMGGGLMELLMAFIGMLLGIDLSGMFGGQKDNNASIDQLKNDKNNPTPEQQANIDKLKKEINFAEIFKDNEVSKKEFQ